MIISCYIKYYPKYETLNKQNSDFRLLKAKKMEFKGKQLSIILVVAGLILGLGIGYMVKPSAPETTGDGSNTVTVEVAPLNGKTIKIGDVLGNTGNLEVFQPLIKEILEEDINTYAETLGYDVDFNFLIDDAMGQAAIHLEKVQGFKSIGVNVFLGGQSSSHAQAALSYCNDNDMIMWSSSSTSPLLALDDNLFRLCPTDVVQAPAIARMLESQGKKAVIVIYRGDAWADGIINYFEPEFTNNGGVIIEKIRYAAETAEFSNYLQTADKALEKAIETYGEENCAVELIATGEFVTMITQASDYPTLYNVPWFGSDGSTFSAQAMDDAPTQAAHLRIYSTYPGATDSEKFRNLYDRLYALVHMPFGFFSACHYDIGWILAESIIEAQSDDAMDILPLQDDICYRTFGTTGWLRLDESGDRYATNYQIWRYGDVDGETQCVQYGMYDTVAEQVIWDTEALGFVPTP